jgi:rRNA-processing protein FCF1
LFQGVINLDTNTVIAFVAEGSPIRHQLKAFVGNQQLVIVQTAYDEFLRIIQASECLSPSSVFIDR